jgi:hypothetical protein
MTLGTLNLFVCLQSRNNPFHRLTGVFFHFLWRACFLLPSKLTWAGIVMWSISLWDSLLCFGIFMNKLHCCADQEVSHQLLSVEFLVVQVAVMDTAKSGTGPGYPSVRWFSSVIFNSIGTLYSFVFTCKVIQCCYTAITTTTKIQCILLFIS